MAYQRFLDKSQMPDEDLILDSLGEAKQIWLDIHEYIHENYDFSPELKYFTKKYGWSIRYRKNKKTFCYLFPENGAFSILIVLGKEEAKRVDLIKDQLNNTVKETFEHTEQLHDGRWMWIRVIEKSDICSFKLLLSAKKKPQLEEKKFHHESLEER